MTQDVVEVAARFGDTLLEVALVERRFVVGDAPGADLRIAGVPPVVVDGFDVRGPRGTQTLRFGDRVRLEVGPVELEVARVRRPVAQVPHQRIERRPLAYLALSLTAHVALYAIATSSHLSGDVAPGTPNVRLIANHTSAPLAAKSEVEAPRVPTDTPATDDDDADKIEPVSLQLPDDGDHPVEAESADEPVLAQAASDLAKEAPSKDTEPCSGRDCGIIKTGGYVTTPSRRGAGADFELAPRRPVDVSVVGCRVGEGCKTAAGNDQADLRAAVESNLGDVMACFRRGGTKAVIDFQIDANGKFERIVPAQRGAEGRDNDAAGCISEVLAKVEFPRPPGGEPRKVTLAFARD
jgi:hypothetical protein